VVGGGWVRSTLVGMKRITKSFILLIVTRRFVTHKAIKLKKISVDYCFSVGI
jgi:hypothetical protein